MKCNVFRVQYGEAWWSQHSGFPGMWWIGHPWRHQEIRDTFVLVFLSGWLHRAASPFLSQGHHQLGSTAVLQLKALCPNVLQRDHLTLPSQVRLFALLLTLAWRTFRTECLLKPSDKMHKLLLDSCHSPGKGCSAAALWLSWGPGQARVVSPLRLPSQAALGEVWMGPWGWCSGPETSDVQASGVTTQTDLWAIGTRLVFLWPPLNPFLSTCRYSWPEPLVLRWLQPCSKLTVQAGKHIYHGWAAAHPEPPLAERRALTQREHLVTSWNLLPWGPTSRTHMLRSLQFSVRMVCFQGGM